MKEITVEARTEQIGTVTEFVNAELEKMGCPMKIQMQIDIAVDELFSNIAYYAYGEKGGFATVRIEKPEDGNGVILTFLDSGIPYDPLKSKAPELSKNIEERKEGGLGIYLVRKTMDGMEYEHRDGRNRLRIRKNF